jgi:hypothetical protein
VNGSAAAADSPMHVFALAPMSRSIAVLSAMLLALPVLLAAASFVSAEAGPVLLGAAVFVLAIYASIWIWWRPSAFEVSPEGLRIRFPGRTRLVPAIDVAEARAIGGPELRDLLGLAIRIGAGGLWGGFGWLWTSRRGIVEFYVSRLDRYVWIERRAGRPLLFTPVDPDAVVRALGAMT